MLTLLASDLIVGVGFVIAAIRIETHIEHGRDVFLAAQVGFVIWLYLSLAMWSVVAAVMIQ